MERKIIKTSDGSTSLYLPDWDENYHSKHGAIQEAYHVFIRHGLDEFKNGEDVRIVEVGFGTGLNCFITFLEAQKRKMKINYVGLEGFPVEQDMIEQLNHFEQLKADEFKAQYELIQRADWNQNTDIDTFFNLIKREQMFEDFEDTNSYDLVYFDAFGARVQPELWTETMFKKMYLAMKSEGILVTYSAKGSVRRAMQSVGFQVERLPGPPGKREMLRAVKPQKK